MLTAIKGTYDNGKVVLSEEPPFKTKAEVIVTFLSNEILQGNPSKQKIKLGLLEGKVDTPDDFNDPLEDFKVYM